MRAADRSIPFLSACLENLRRSGAAGGVFAAILLASALGTSGCSTAPPEGVVAVTPFDVRRYEGRWFEIARLDHAFERGLTDVSAIYRLRPDGSVEVVNRGYDPSKGRWREAVGTARFTGAADRGSLKVSFFGPFYGGYHVVALDQQQYAWSLVMGPDRDYLWILARETQLPEDVRARLLEQARQLGVDVSQLIWVEHSRSDG